MAAKTGKSKDGHVMHYSVGAVIKKDGKFLLLDRAMPPYGFACVAGHVEEGKDPATMLIEKVKEESNLDVTGYELMIEEEVDWNLCSRGIRVHHWYVYKCDAAGEIKLYQGAAKSINWYTLEELKQMKLEPAWSYWFKKLGIL